MSVSFLGENGCIGQTGCFPKMRGQFGNLIKMISLVGFRSSDSSLS